MSHETILWIVFAILVPVVLALDLGIFQRRAHTIKTKEALTWTAAYVMLALVFAAVVYFFLAPEKSLTFLTGYVVEVSLSMDNLFVFLLIFTVFAVPPAYQHRVLFWGIIGAVVMRGIFIGSGIALLQRLEWIIYLFGAFLVYTGIRIAIRKGGEVNPRQNPVLKLCSRYLPMADTYHEGKFFLRDNGRLLFTPLFLVLIVVETTDIVFAVDSIPAILAITRDPFLVYTSNIFAILGLRSMFFALAAATRKLAYINYGLAAILALLGVKMLTPGILAILNRLGVSSLSPEAFHIPAHISLGTVVGILALAAIASVIWPKKPDRPEGEGK
jgi:tellurite resistance protein TerC